MIHFQACPLCEATNIARSFEVETPIGGGPRFQGFRYDCCAECYTFYLVDPVDVSKYYTIRDSPAQRALPRSWNRWVARMVREHLDSASPLRVLDYGGATFTFEKALEDIGIADRVDLEVYDPYSEHHAELSEAHFDIICLQEVLEHLDAPRATLEFLSTRLTPNGRMILTVPHYGTVSALCSEQVVRPANRFLTNFLNVPKHLFLPSPGGLEEVYTASGFETVRWDTIPEDMRSVRRRLQIMPPWGASKREQALNVIRNVGHAVRRAPISQGCVLRLRTS